MIGNFKKNSWRKVSRLRLSNNCSSRKSGRKENDLRSNVRPKKLLKTELILENLNSQVEISENETCEDLDENYIEIKEAKSRKQRKNKERAAAKRVQCEKCGEALKASHIDGHLKKHLTETEYPCDFCDKVFVCLLAYYRHGFRIHNKELVCDKCGKKFSKADYFIRHIKFGHAEKTYTCGYCNFATPESNQLRMHMEKRHLKNYSLFCNVCSKGFFEKSSLKEHENMHTGATPYQCEVCGMSFKIKCTLRAHKFKFHPDLFPHVCGVCGKGLSTKEGLDSHLKLHAENRKFICDICGRNLNTPRSLLEHRRLHTGERPFECGLCMKSYPAQKHLVRHVKLIHTGEKPDKNHECRHCKKKYASRSACLAHEKICLASADCS